MIDLHGVGKMYGTKYVLHDISFSIAPGEFVCITGPSGAGKSTLLHLLSGAEDATSGSVQIDGVDMHMIPPPALQVFRRRLGVVFQDNKLLSNRTVAENIAFPLEVCGVADDEIEQYVNEVLTLVDLHGVANELPTRLSGGEKARVAIGRAIAHDPMIVLADEPTGNIDPEQSMMILKLFKKIHARGATVVIATHDTGLVDALQTRVIELKDGNLVRDSVGGYAKRRATSASKKALKKKVKVTAVRS